MLSLKHTVEQGNISEGKDAREQMKKFEQNDHE